MLTVRPPAVAGQFYSAKAAQLTHDLQQLLNQASPHPLIPKALIVPHAGYIYSGAIAATAYATLRPLAATIRRVVLLGPAHRVAVNGLALPGVEAFDTPLGRVPLDTAGAHALQALPQVSVNRAAHAQEHALEVQLPFLQQTLQQFTLLPLVVGRATAAQVAEVLETVWGGDETLIVVSSDLSHYLPYISAQRVDGATAQTILALQSSVDHEQACGATPIGGLLLAAKRHQMTAHLLDLRNSGDTAGSRDEVVGYGAFAFTQDDSNRLDVNQGQTLVALARAAIGARLGVTSPMPPHAGWLDQPAACFVTLMRHGQLRGCVGSLQAVRTLAADVRHNAVAAALHDPRFTPLTAAELRDTRVEVSLLSPAQPLTFRSEADALSQLQPGIDGVILEYHRHKATFLPQVWEQLTQPKDFIAQLKIKAGLRPDFWSDDIMLSRYGVQKWSEEE